MERGLTWSEGKALAALDPFWPSWATGHQVAVRGGGLEAKSVGVTLSHLGRQGLVEVHRPGRREGGSTIYRITAHGRRVLELWKQENQS